MSVKLTKAQRAFLTHYRPMWQNGIESPVDTVWSRRSGNSIRGLASCRSAGLITSYPDDILRKGGWRHDLTPAGRAALDQGVGDSSPSGGSDA